MDMYHNLSEIVVKKTLEWFYAPTLIASLYINPGASK